MKTKLIASLGAGAALSAALTIFFSIPIFGQTRLVTAASGIAVSTATSQLPSGTKIIGQVLLHGQPVTRMYTQSEYGRTYLYIEHGGEPSTTVDVTRKSNPQVVNHAPGKFEPGLYEELFEGGTIDVAPQSEVCAGFDNVGGHGMRSVLETSNPEDVKLLQAFGLSYANLADRDRHLVFFASTLYLFVVQDNRITAVNLITK